VGQAVRATDGPYAGQTGVVTAVDAAGRVSVFIDDCCHPMLDPSAVTRIQARDVGRAARHAKLSDPRGEMVRMEIDSRDLGDGF
jgi:hypothetical protein